MTIKYHIHTVPDSEDTHMVILFWCVYMHVSICDWMSVCVVSFLYLCHTHVSVQVSAAMCAHKNYKGILGVFLYDFLPHLLETRSITKKEAHTFC